MAERTLYGAWEIVAPLGQGGQGSVFRVRNTALQSSPPVSRLLDAIRDGASYTYSQTRDKAGHDLVSIIEEIAGTVLARDRVPVGALKILHPISNPAAAQKATDRQAREVGALKEFTHPALVRLLEESSAERWFVMEYFDRGTLAGHIKRYCGDVVGALRAIRPVAEAIAALHSRGHVHRDIKPDNIFIANDGHLVLGDFGLIINPSGTDERLTDTYENVGSKNWMPSWATGVRMDDVTPAFDVFTLGKVLWAMIAGKQFLRLWYYDSPEFNLELIFSKDPTMRWANRLFKTCIVEHEKSCLKNANELLAKIDETTRAIDRGGQLFGKNEDRIECQMCGIGYCTVRIPFGHGDMKLYCNHCGYEHSFRGVKEKPSWTP